MNAMQRQALVDLAILLPHLRAKPPGSEWHHDELAALLRQHRGLRRVARSRVRALGEAMGAEPDRYRSRWTAGELPGLLLEELETLRPVGYVELRPAPRDLFYAELQATEIDRKLRGARVPPELIGVPPEPGDPAPEDVEAFAEAFREATTGVAGVAVPIWERAWWKASPERHRWATSPEVQRIWMDGMLACAGVGRDQ